MRILTYFVRDSITVQLKSCLFCLDSTALLLLNEQQTGGQLYSDTHPNGECSLYWLSPSRVWIFRTKVLSRFLKTSAKHKKANSLEKQFFNSTSIFWPKLLRKYFLLIVYWQRDALKTLSRSLLSYIWISVTRLGENSPLWQKFQRLWQIYSLLKMLSILW